MNLSRICFLASSLGIFFALFGLIGLIYSLFSWISGRTVPGWTSVIITSMILGSAQLLVLGIFGEYLGRLYIETKRRPLYIIDRIVSQGREDIWAENLKSKLLFYKIRLSVIIIIVNGIATDKLTTKRFKKIQL